MGSQELVAIGAVLSKHRFLILIVGPIPIVLASWGVSRLMRPERQALAEVNHAMLAPRSDSSTIESDHATTPRVRAQSGPELRTSLRPIEGLRPPQPARPNAQVLEAACQKIVEELRPRLGRECQIVVHAPFVLAGDLSQDELNNWYTQTIGPASRAMAACYFPTVPDKPIAVLLFSGEAPYAHYARELFNEEGISIYGYYKRRNRVLLMNISTGGGTLVHELTHALVDFDLPDLPDWLNEGIASLHEQCHIREDESGIDGLENWRLPILQEAIQKQRLRSLQSLAGDDDFRTTNVGLNYAQARYFVLYLQRQGLLEDFVRRWRRNQKDDPLALDTVLATFPGQSWDEIDAAFQKWALELKR